MEAMAALRQDARRQLHGTAAELAGALVTCAIPGAHPLMGTTVASAESALKDL